MRYDAVVIGAGPNGLVAASYLAQAGRRVLVLDRRGSDDEGGASSGWVPGPIVRELELGRFGWRPHEPDPWLTIALPDGGTLDLSRDVATTAAAIKAVSPADASRWPEFCHRMAQMAAVLERLYLAPPPNPIGRTMADQWRLARLGLYARRLGRQAVTDLLRTMPMSVADLLNDWFEHEALKGGLGAIGVRGVSQGPRAAGTAFVLLHHHVGSVPGVFVSGGRRVTGALRVSARERGVEVQFGAEVTQVLVEGGRAVGVTLESGQEVRARLVLSSADPRRTFLQLVDPAWLSPEFRHAVSHIRYRGVRAIVRMVLRESAGFERLSVVPSLDAIERAADDAKYGRPSADPMVEAEAHAREDGRHVVVAHAQYAPYRLSEGTWDHARRDAFGEAIVQRLATHVPRLRAALTERQVYLPVDMETEYGITEGQFYHGELMLDQMLFMRPVAGWSQYRTPIQGLYLCGAGTHPGGGITGAAGRNAARACLAG